MKKTIALITAAAGMAAMAACGKQDEQTTYTETAHVTIRQANPGYLYDAPFEYDSQLVHDRKNRQYILLTKDDEFAALVPVTDFNGTPAVTPQE